MSDQPLATFTCTACGGPMYASPRTARMLQGDPKFLELGQLCWVCARLKYSVMAEAALAEEAEA